MKTLPALAILFLAAPAFAQTADDPAYQMLDGIGACMTGEGRPDLTAKNFEGIGWNSEADPDMGVVNFARSGSEATFAYASDKGDFCHVESTAIGTGDAETMFNLFLMGGNTGIEVTAEGTDADGCAARTLSNGAVATFTSGGNDPVCTSDANSAVRFVFPGGN